MQCRIDTDSGITVYKSMCYAHAHVLQYVRIECIQPGAMARMYMNVVKYINLIWYQ